MKKVKKPTKEETDNAIAILNRMTSEAFDSKMYQLKLKPSEGEWVVNKNRSVVRSNVFIFFDKANDVATELRKKDVPCQIKLDWITDYNTPTTTRDSARLNNKLHYIEVNIRNFMKSRKHYTTSKKFGL